VTIISEPLPSSLSRRTETQAAPFRYVAELVGADIDSVRATRWLIALMVQAADLIERSEVEKALCESREQFRWRASIVEFTDDAIVSRAQKTDNSSSAGLRREARPWLFPRTQVQ
jgi:hypothetical protein